MIVRDEISITKFSYDSFTSSTAQIRYCPALPCQWDGGLSLRLF